MSFGCKVPRAPEGSFGQNNLPAGGRKGVEGRLNLLLVVHPVAEVVSRCSGSGAAVACGHGHGGRPGNVGQADDEHSSQ